MCTFRFFKFKGDLVEIPLPLAVAKHKEFVFCMKVNYR
jgi:hypothetical protein